MEVVLYTLHYQLSTTLVGLLVVFRSWRYVRISHGIMEVTAEIADHKFAKLLSYTEQLEKMMKENGMPLPEDPKVQKLRKKQECDLEAQVRRHHAEEKRLKHLSDHSCTGETETESDGSGNGNR